jgi:ankyrin repeat protein
MSSVVLSIRSLPQYLFPESPKNDLQAAIDSNQTADVLAIMKKNEVANQPLSNGQMPLNYAIRHGKLELVDGMLKELKLATDSKDSQGLTAVDHAMIGNNPKMIALVVGNMLGQSFDAAINKTFSVQEQAVIQGIADEVNSIRSGAIFTHLPELHKAARSGDLAEVKRLLDPKDPQPYDSYGMTPLHHAVLAGKTEVIQWLLENGAKADILTQGGRPLLHLATIGGHTDLVSSLILSHKLNPNAADAKGRSPLHYAMTQENLSTAKALIQYGANPLLIVEEKGFSPLEIMLSMAKIRSVLCDPLELSGLQILMFAGIVAPWVSQATGLPLVDDLVILGQIAQVLTAYKSLGSFKSKAAFYGSVLSGCYIASQILLTGDTTGSRLVLHALGAISVWKSYMVGKGCIEGLSSCWKNGSLETYRPIRNAIVHSVTGLNVASNIFDTINLVIEGNAFLNAWDKHMETEDGDTFRNLDGAPGVGEATQRYFYIRNFYGNFQRENTGRGTGHTAGETLSADCSIPDICNGKLDIGTEAQADCILALNPKCQSHAEKILDFGSKSTCEANLKTLRVNYHPDRHLRDSWKDKAELAYKNIAVSADKLQCKL